MDRNEQSLHAGDVTMASLSRHEDIHRILNDLGEGLLKHRICIPAETRTTAGFFMDAN